MGIKTGLKGSRIVKRRKWAHMLNLPDDAADEYLLTCPGAIFKLKIILTDEMYNKKKGMADVCLERSQRASLPIIDRVGAPVDINYADDNTGKLNRIRWMEDLGADLPPTTNQARLLTYIRWLRSPMKAVNGDIHVFCCSS